MQTRASLGLPPAVIIDGRDPRNIVVSPEDGMFEALLAYKAVPWARLGLAKVDLGGADIEGRISVRANYRAGAMTILNNGHTVQAVIAPGSLLTSASTVRVALRRSSGQGCPALA